MALTVLCGTDLSESGDVACEAALRLATRLRASVLLVHVIPPSHASIILDDPKTGPFNRHLARSAADLEHAVRAAVETKLRAIAEPFVREGVQVTTRVLEGRPAEILRQAATDARAAMIVVGTHGRTPPGRWFVGSVAERVVRESDIPVLIVREREIGKIRRWSDASHALRLVVGCSPDDSSRSAIDLARAFTKSAQPAELSFGYIYWPPAEAAARRLEAIDAEGSAEVEREIADQLRRQIGDPSAQVLVEPSFGRAPDALANQAAAKNADLLVIGTRGLKGADLMMEGSFALGAIRQAEVPVLCVPREARLAAWMESTEPGVRNEAET